jgi:hypothetical protein
MMRELKQAALGGRHSFGSNPPPCQGSGTRRHPTMGVCRRT